MKATARAALVALCLAAPMTARAQIFKFVKPDGTVMYTDKLSDLPKERRRYYNRLLAEQEKKNREAEKEVEARDAKIRRLEAERERLRRERIAAQERRRRLAALESTLESLREQNRARDKAKELWRERVRVAERDLAEKLEAYRDAKRAWQALAIRADYTLFPGQVTEKQELRERMEKLENEVDALAHQLNVVIPEEARKAGVPPGWLRD